MSGAIVLDSEDELQHVLHRPCSRAVPHRSRNRRPSVSIIDDDSSETLGEEPESVPLDLTNYEDEYNPDDFMTDEDFERYLTDMSANVTQSRRAEAAQHVLTRKEIPSYTSCGRTYRKGKSVELEDNTFLRIYEIVQDSGGDVFLRGYQFQRFETMDSLFPRRVNEVCWIVDLAVGQMESDAEYQEVKLKDIKGMRIIRLTNYQYPEMRDEDRREGLLYCRAKYVRVWERTGSSNKRVAEAAVVFLSAEEADTGFRVNSEDIRQNWRGNTRLGGSFTGSRYEPATIDLSNNDNNTQPLTPSKRKKIQMYTFGDGFCGAGGVSSGALQAGLRVEWGFDMCYKAMETYRLNFPTAVGETCTVTDFLTNDPADIRVDIMHFSPPCQTFSPAHTLSSSADDANEACIFATRELLARVRPRIATMEETSGLQERHKEFLYATIHNFIDLGYSVRWALVNCQDYGVPQRRKRLVIIGAGPGESLPSFPPPTHGPADDPERQPGTSLLPYTTILDAIGSLPSDARNHDPERCIYESPKPAYNPHAFAKTVTCNGGENYHPSGTRTYTHREAACLQTFPVDYRFCGVGVLKQIGNAVPPVLARAVMRHIVKHLERVDGRRGRSGARL